jgi:DNA-binding CsgD family transcriptional regulator
MPVPPKVPYDEIAALLQRGDSTESEVAKQLGISRTTVRNARQRYGLPAPLHGSKPRHNSIEDAYRAQTVPARDGHADWAGWRTGNDVPMVKHCYHEESAYRVAFRIHHGRDPESVVIPVCGKPRCVAGAHLEDGVIRQSRETARRASGPRKRGPRPNASRAEIIELIGQGLSSRRIAAILRTDPKRVNLVRAEAGLPQTVPLRAPQDSLRQRWQAHTRTVDGGHTEWVGSLRGGTPVFTYSGEHYMARRVAFEMANGRAPEGRVKPGCDLAGCVAPAHMEDARMRAQFTAIFGEAA